MRSSREQARAERIILENALKEAQAELNRHHRDFEKIRFLVDSSLEKYEAIIQTREASQMEGYLMIALRGIRSIVG